MSGVEIRPGLVIPDGDLRFVTSRSSGPGGQHVNKVETRVTLLFDLEGSAALDPRQKALIRDRLASRLNREGVLQVSAQRSRSQADNRAEATLRFAKLLAGALTRRRRRRPTAPTSASRRRRRRDKEHRSRVKGLRSRPVPRDE